MDETQEVRDRLTQMTPAQWVEMMTDEVLSMEREKQQLIAEIRTVCIQHKLPDPFPLMVLPITPQTSTTKTDE